jgi:hypothetical protein
MNRGPAMSKRAAVNTVSGEPIWVCEKGHVDDHHLIAPNPDALCSRCGGRCTPFRSVEHLAREYVEWLRVNVGLLVENQQLKRRVGELENGS